MAQKPNLTGRLDTISDRERTYYLLTFISRPWSVVIVALLAVLAIGGFQAFDVYAQSRAISIAIPESLLPIFRDVVLPRFHETHPDIYVELRAVSTELYPNLRLPTSVETLEDYLDATNQLMSQADVHFIFPYTVSSESTRAGYFLDLEPLIAADASLLTEDFVPAMREAFTWDGGQWALPVLATPLVVIYDADAFDTAGLTYPTESWTFDDFAGAARQLVGKDSPGMQVSSFDLPVFLRILAGQSFTDESFPPQPNFDFPELEELVEQWAALEAEGVVTSGFSEGIPLRFARISDLIDRDLQGSLLKGQAGADVYSVAISSGTNEPEAAYRLAVYLTTVPELTTVTPSVLPVRYSVQNQHDDGQWSLPEEAVTLRQRALESGLTPADVQFGHYLRQALALIATGEPADVALRNVQIAANDNLRRAESIRGTLQVEVPPATLPTVAEGTTVRFGLFTGSTQLLNRSQWQAAIDEFVAITPDTDHIEFNFVPPTEGYWDEIPRNDCVFGYDYTQYSDDMLLPLDPLLNADPTFDPADVVGDVMLETQREGNTYAIPAAVLPYVLRYDRERFAQAGIPEPDGTWTVNEFVDALQQLDAVTEGAPLFLHLNYSTPWELLMAAYGAAPVDYATSPPTVRLTNENVVPVVRQVLDLARLGLIEYPPMATFFGSGSSPSYSPPLITEQLRDLTSADDLDRYGLVTFPIGTETTPISFYTTSGFIFAHALQPEVCYRWLREITRHPELFQGMPAYHSVIDDPVTQSIYGESGITTFRHFADMMEAPNRVFIRSFGLGTGDSMFMVRAFDRYVLEDADLEAELALAQELTTAYRACISAGDKDMVDCLLETDPTIRESIPPYVLGDR